jgi:dUTPase
VQILPCSGFAHNHLIETKCGAIEPDYFGNIAIVFHNYGANTYVRQNSETAYIQNIILHLHDILHLDSE